MRASHPSDSWQYAGDPFQRAIEPELAEKFVPVEPLARRLTRRGEYAQRDRKIEPPTVFGQVGRREIHRDASSRKFESGIGQRGPHSLFTFANRGGRQTDDGENRQPGAEVHFNRNRRRAQANLRPAGNARQAHGRQRFAE